MKAYPGQIWQECRVPKFGWWTRVWLWRVPLQTKIDGPVTLRFKSYEGSIYIYGCDVVPGEVLK